jgi:serine/threonine protein kinase
LSITLRCRIAGETVPLSFTPRYAAPEVVAEHNAGRHTLLATPTADVWALGVIAYELLTGERAFPADLSDDAVLSGLVAKAALPWEGPQPGTAGLRGAGATVLACLQRDPRRRPRVSAVLRNFDAILKEDPSTGAPVDRLFTTC